MLKDKFNWKFDNLYIKNGYFGVQDEFKVTIIGTTKNLAPTPFLDSVDYERFKKEIEYCLNNDFAAQKKLYKTMINSVYGSRGQCKSLASKVNTVYSPDGEGIAIGMVRKDTGVELECHLENFIEKVIFNDPATIIIWKDGTKTVVKTQEGDTFDPMVGMAMCIAKKAMGNQGNYFEEFKKWCEPWYEEQEKDNGISFDMEKWKNYMKEVINKVLEKAIIDGEPQEEVSPKVCMNCRHCAPRINGGEYFCGYGYIITYPGVEKCSNWEQHESEAVLGQEVNNNGRDED